MRILAFGAHPDDVEIGCGGSLLLHSGDGDEVFIVDVTNGDAGTLDTPPVKTGEIRWQEGQIAAAMMGAADRVSLEYHDGGLVPHDLTLVTAAGRLIRKYAPEIVYVHHPGDAHPDHQAVATAVIEGCRRAATSHFPDIGEQPHRVREIRLYEVWTPVFDPLLFTDISAVIDRKQEIIRAHTSQQEQRQFDEVITGLNRYRSISCPGSSYAEAFGLARPVW